MPDRFTDEFRAATIPVDPVTGVAGFIRPGDYVDVIVALKIVDASGAKLQFARTLLKDRLVLATDQIVNPDDTRAGTSGYGTITLRLTPVEANKVVFSMAASKEQSTLYCTLARPGATPRPGYDPVTADLLYKEVEREIAQQVRRR